MRNDDLVPLYVDYPGKRHTALRYAQARRGRFRPSWASYHPPLYAVACDVFDRWIEKLTRRQREDDRRIPLGWLGSLPETALSIHDAPVMRMREAADWIANKFVARYRHTDPEVYHHPTVRAIRSRVESKILYDFAPEYTHALVSEQEMRFVRAPENRQESMDTLASAYLRRWERA